MAKSHPDRVEPSRRLFGSWLHLDRASPHLWLLRCQSRGEGKKGDGVTRALSGSGVCLLGKLTQLGFEWMLDFFQDLCWSMIIVHFTKKARWNIINQTTWKICWSCKPFSSCLLLCQGMLLCPAGQPLSRIINVDSFLCSQRFVHGGFSSAHSGIRDSSLDKCYFKVMSAEVILKVSREMTRWRFFKWNWVF